MIILLTGPNSFGVRAELARVTKDFANKHGVHAIERVDGEALDASRLPDLLQGVSLFAAERLVVIRDASKNKPVWDALGDMVEKADGATVILVDSNPDKRSRTYKQLAKHAEVRTFPDLSEAELAKWAQGVTKALGSSIDTRTAQYLVGQVGVNQWGLYNELQKLAGASKIITRELIDTLIDPQPQASAFELLDAALAGETQRTLQILGRIRQLEDPYKLFGLLVSQVQTLALVASARGKPGDVIAKDAGIHPFVVRKMQAVARLLSAQQLRTVIEATVTADDQMKSSGADPWVLLEQCLGKITIVR